MESLCQLEQKVNTSLIEIALSEACSIGFFTGIDPDDNLHSFSVKETNQGLFFRRETREAIDDDRHIFQLLFQVPLFNLVEEKGHLGLGFILVLDQHLRDRFKNRYEILSFFSFPEQL